MAPTSSASIPPGATVDARVDVGPPIEPRWFASDGQSLWVHEPTSLVRVDLATSAVTGQVPLNAMEYGYATTGAGSLWQTDYERAAVLRIDPVADAVVASIFVGMHPLGVAVTAGSVWVADEQDEAISRVDPKTNTMVATIPLGPPGWAGPQVVTAGPGGVWVDVPNMGQVVRIDTATNTVGLSVPLEGPVASDGKEVWIGVQGSGNGSSAVVRIDPVSGNVITWVDLDTQGIGGIAVGLGSVWVTSGGLTRIDTEKGRIVGHLDVDGASGNVIVAGGSVWVTADDHPSVLRLSPTWSWPIAAATPEKLQEFVALLQEFVALLMEPLETADTHVEVESLYRPRRVARAREGAEDPLSGMRLE